MSLNLLRAHGSTTHYQYQYQDCRCVACGGAMSASNAAYAANHKAERCAYHAAHYDAAHREEKRVYNDAHKDEKRQELSEFTEWLQTLRSVNGCEDCGVHEGGLEHHHVDPETKLYNISNMCNCSLDSLEEELEKCVVLCVPCHNKRHVELRAICL